MRLRIARPDEAERLAELSGGAGLDRLHVALAEDAAGVAGIMGLSSAGRLDPVWVAEGGRGRAAATALHDAIEAEVLRSGLATLTASVEPSYRAVLERRGWQAVSAGEGRIGMERRADGAEGDVI